jgi:predicted esterase
MLIDREAFKRGRLTARPVRHININGDDNDLTTGVHALNIDHKRDALLYVPTNYHPNYPAALAIMLHGAGGDAHHGLSLLRFQADEYNVILLAPFSRHASWDIISLDHFGPDVAFINRMLEVAFARFAIKTTQLAIGGFSDGASYALSLGLINGNLFSHILALSPGFYYSPQRVEKPKIFISHGTKDTVLPIGPCSRKIVPGLQKDGYDLVYREFEGEHILPQQIAKECIAWFTHSNP